MGVPFYPVFMLVLALACLSVAFGYKLGSTPIPKEELERIKEKAFEEAKKEYINYFHDRFDPQGETLRNAYMHTLQDENTKLLKHNQQLAAELKKEKEKNGSISSS
jgi:hypothetical protein